MADQTGLRVLIQVLAFACAALLTLGATQVLAQRGRVRRRQAELWGGAGALGPETGAGRRRDAARLGWSAAAMRTMRVELFNAGFHGPDAVSVYAGLRLVMPVALMLVGLVASRLVGAWGALETALLVLILAAIGVYGPRAYLSRRARQLSQEFQLLFPNYLDMLVVCVNAGLSLEAALDRAGRELGRGAGSFRAQIDLMAGEMRAGKSTVDAIRAFAQRLAFREAQSFAALLGQTLELGTDVAQALAIFADEMRDKRMAKAEEKAAALPPKLTLPLGLFIFPVVLIVVLAPAVMKVMATVGG